MQWWICSFKTLTFVIALLLSGLIPRRLLGRQDESAHFGSSGHVRLGHYSEFNEQKLLHEKAQHFPLVLRRQKSAVNPLRFPACMDALLRHLVLRHHVHSLRVISKPRLA